MDLKELKALISLLDDSDNEVIKEVSANLLKQGVHVIPELEKAWETSINDKIQERLEGVIYNIQFNSACDGLLNWISSGAENLLEGSFYVSRLQFPEISFKLIDSDIEKIKKDVWIELNTNLTALEKVKIINYILYNLHGFSRNTNNFYSPQNSFINQVIETKKGNPISLAIVYLSVAWKLDLPIFGVNLPKNFILAYKDEFRHYDSPDELKDILFYINPYNKGAVLGKREIDYFLEQQNIEPKNEYYIPCSNIDIILRLLNNLILSYEKLGFNDKIRKIKELLTKINNSLK